MESNLIVWSVSQLKIGLCGHEVTGGKYRAASRVRRNLFASCIFRSTFIVVLGNR